MTRIIAGEYRGRLLLTPRGRSTRPTADRVREAMFASIGSITGGWDGLRALDLFAGSGALGLEAISRGASVADLVENAPRAAETLNANIKALGTTSARVHRNTASGFLEAGPNCGSEDWDVVFIDPPYALSHANITELLTALRPRLADRIAGGPVVVIEREKGTYFDWPEGYRPIRDKIYGNTHLWYAQ